MVTVWQPVTGSWEHDSNNVRVSVTNNGAGPPLDVVQVSPTSGYIQTPGWGHLSSHPKDMNSVVRVQVPENFTAMFTTLHLNLTGKRVRCDTSKVTLVVYETNMAHDNIVWRCRVNLPPLRRRLLKGSDLYLHFRCGEKTKDGFRIFFSVNKQPDLSQRVGYDMWNCSVPNFADFKPHFPCDLYPQCVDKEDERDCPYFSEECGLGFVTLDAYCLLYVKSRAHTSWRDNEFFCEQRGLRMASFRRREDYNRLVQYLEPMAAYWGFWMIAVGIRTPSASLPIIFDVLCEIPKRVSSVGKTTLFTGVRVHLASNSNGSHLPLLDCPLGHVTRDFLACDVQSTCWRSRDAGSCAAPLAPLPPSFACTNGFEGVPYTLVCDVRPDCSDGSDESFCEFPPCDLPEPFYCSDRECVPWNTLCDGQKNCYNAADEDLCSDYKQKTTIRPPPPAIVQLNQDGQFSVLKMTQSLLADLSPAVCPDTHFQCPDNGYCMPVFLRCNGVYDCLGSEDEAGCDSYTCPGFYRCRGFQVCLHPDHLCDDIFQCPRHDDEILCDLSCPENCTCFGLAFYCRQSFHEKSTKFAQLRYLDARGSRTDVSDLAENFMLVYLSLAANGLTSIGKLHLPNLRVLDLSDNQLSEIHLNDLNHLPSLETLSLSGNPMKSLFQYAEKSIGDISLIQSVADLEAGNVTSQQAETSHDEASVTFHPMSSGGMDGVSFVFENSSEDVKSSSSEFLYANVAITPLRTLDISRVKFKVLNPSFLSLLPNLHTVNMSGCGVDTLLGKGFQALTQLRALDLRGCPLTYFPRHVFRGLQELKTVHSDNYKLCCPATLPAGFVLKNCRAPSDLISSCVALVGSNTYRVFLSVFAPLALLGNVCCLLYHMLIQESKGRQGVYVLVVHLCIADLLMGVCVSVLGVADRLYQGTYLWDDNAWRNGTACHLAGFLSLVSSEVSALVICLITVDRFLALRFPFTTFRFDTVSAQAASICAWALGCLIAAVPLAPRLARWQLYSRTGICIPFPISSNDTPGFVFTFGIMIMANVFLFLVIAAGQIYIYFSVHADTVISCETTQKSEDHTIARRFFTVVTSDFLCWFPIGLLGMLAATGTPIADEIRVIFAVLVLPLNSAINPFLYMLNIVLEKRRKRIEEKVKERLMIQFRSKVTESEIVSAKNC